MTNFNKHLADSNHALQIRKDRKRREFWQDVEFYVTEAVIGVLALAMIAFTSWWILTL